MANEKTIEDFWNTFRRNALSDMTPPRILAAIKGAYYAGAQTGITLTTEALDVDPTTAPVEIHSLFAECQGFFAVAKADATSRIEEKKDGKKKRS